MHLAYIVDPMCSWCYGFDSVLSAEVARRELRVELVMGGLAPDSDEPMPAETQIYVQRAWHAVTERTGAVFNGEFWERNTPRRSTYPSCRAVIAAGWLASGVPRPRGLTLWLDEAPGAMLHAIQHAYYREARNPSDLTTLVECAASIGLDAAAFEDKLRSPDVELELQAHLARRDRWGLASYPSLAFLGDNAAGGHALASGCLSAAELTRVLDSAGL